MTFQKIDQSKVNNKFELLGVTQVSLVTAMLSLSNKTSSPELVLDIYLKINEIISTCWNLYTMSINAAYGEKNDIDMYSHLKKQILILTEQIIKDSEHFYNTTLKAFKKEMN